MFPLNGVWREVLNNVGPDADSSAMVPGADGYSRDYTNQQTTLPHRASYAPISSTGMTVAVIADVDALTNTGFLVGKGAAGTNSPFQLHVGVTGGDNSQLDFVRATASATIRYRTGASDTFAAGAKNVLIAATCTGADIYFNPPTLWVNETSWVKAQGSQWTFTGSGIGNATDGGGQLYIGKRSDNTSYLDGRIRVIAIANRPWGAEELREFRRAPYALLRPLESPVFYSLGGGGDQTITVSDTGAGSDSITIGAALSIAESGAGTDALSIAAALALADSGAGTDGTPSVTVTVTLTDTGTGTETFAGSATIALTDSGAGSDALSILTATLVSIADSATGSDAVAITVSLSLADAGTGTDAFSAAAQLALTDSGSGADSLGVVSDILKTVADVASGTDAVSIAVQVVVPDTGTGLETLGITAALAVLDTGTGYDVVITTAPGGAKIVTITFRASGRRVAFSASARSINFTMH